MEPRTYQNVAQGAFGGPTGAEITLAASATTDGMDITVQLLNAQGQAVAGAYSFDLYISEDADGIGISTNDAGTDLAADTGAVIEAFAADLHWRVVTDDAGLFIGTIVDSDNPADLYVCVIAPVSGAVIAEGPTEAASWEGGA